MTQFNTLGPQLVRNIENAQDASVRTRFKRNQQLGQKQQQLDQKIASGASRTSLRDRRDRALIEQGVDPDQLRQGIRADRQDLSRTLRESRRAFQSGDTAQGEALRAQAEGLRRDINDRFKIVTPKLGDLPPEQQAANRAAGQDQFNKSLAATAGLARQSATDAGAQQTQKLARIGEQAYRLENGGPPPAGTDPSVLAKYALTASPAVLDRVTRGVGLPADPTIAADANAQRLESLAAGGYTLPERAAYTRTEDPALLDRFRLRQTDQATADESSRTINRNVLQTAESQSRQGAAQAGTGAALATQQQSIASDPSNPPVETEINQIEQQNRLRKAQIDSTNLQSQLQDQTESLRKKGLTFDVGLNTTAIATIGNMIGTVVNRGEHEELDKAVTTIEQQLSQFSGKDAQEFASYMLQALETEYPNATFGKVEINSPSLLGGKAFGKTARAQQAEIRISSLIAQLRSLAAGVSNSSTPPAKFARESLPSTPTSRFDRFAP